MIMVKVELYGTGKRNPVFLLDGEDDEVRLKCLVAQLTASSSIDRKQNTGLGYSGFKLTLDDKPLQVYRETVNWNGKYLLDKDRRVETWLLDKAKDQIGEALLTEISKSEQEE
jgi:hypothetical protein